MRKGLATVEGDSSLESLAPVVRLALPGLFIVVGSSVKFQATGPFVVGAVLLVLAAVLAVGSFLVRLRIVADPAARKIELQWRAWRIRYRTVVIGFDQVKSIRVAGLSFDLSNNYNAASGSQVASIELVTVRERTWRIYQARSRDEAKVFASSLSEALGIELEFATNRTARSLRDSIGNGEDVPVAVVRAAIFSRRSVITAVLACLGLAVLLTVALSLLFHFGYNDMSPAALGLAMVVTVFSGTWLFSRRFARPTVISLRGNFLTIDQPGWVWRRITRFGDSAKIRLTFNAGILDRPPVLLVEDAERRLLIAGSGDEGECRQIIASIDKARAKVSALGGQGCQE